MVQSACCTIMETRVVIPAGEEAAVALCNTKVYVLGAGRGRRMDKWGFLAASFRGRHCLKAQDKGTHFCTVHTGVRACVRVCMCV